MLLVCICVLEIMSTAIIHLLLIPWEMLVLFIIFLLWQPICLSQICKCDGNICHLLCDVSFFINDGGRKK